MFGVVMLIANPIMLWVVILIANPIMFWVVIFIANPLIFKAYISLRSALPISNLLLPNYLLVTTSGLWISGTH
jgi:hypothetical protein